ncbi:MAG TPA: hypothetical protein VG675_00025 [Bryobacteraceae bacterium]|nr:hypothetical protein [Bryobacteraceae bacterium]
METNDQFQKIVADVKTAQNQLGRAVALMSSDGLEDRAKSVKLVSQARAKLEDVTVGLSQGVGVLFGSRGGSKTAERGPEYYRKIAGMRKTRAGGRPRKDAV